MEESLGLGKKSSGAETDTETWSWFRLPIPKSGFGRTLRQTSSLFTKRQTSTKRRFIKNAYCVGT